MTEAILLGTVAVRIPGAILKWDAENLKFTDKPEANSFLQRRYREGWNVAGF